MTTMHNAYGKTWKTIKVILPAVLVLLFTGCINDYRTLGSFKKVDDYPLYVMRYYGDYGIKDLQTGRGLNGIERWAIKKLLAPSNTPQCSCFAAMDPQSEQVFGRNFDWNTKAALLLFTDPSDGYASVSMVDISYFGFDRTHAGLLSHLALLYAPQAPFDGMNECGLAVGEMSIPRSNGGNDPEKETLGMTQLIRQMLDHASNVDEAIAIAQKYNIVFTYGPTLHLLVSDASGHSAVIEFLNGTPTVIRNSQPFQIATNFIIAGMDTDQAIKSCRRYRKAWQTLQQAQGRLDPGQAMALLNDISQPKYTVWSAVYGQSTGKIQLAMGRQYDNVYEFSLKMKDRDNTKTSVHPIPPQKATQPYPVKWAALHRNSEPVLRWAAGANATSHHVYFGQDKDDLALLDKTRKSKIRLSTLENGKTYYWRVDEVQSDGTIITGDLWNFHIDSLVGHWKMDETEGRIGIDSTNNGNQAALQDDALFKPSEGIQDGAVYLDGTGDTVNIGNFSLTTGSATITAWINGHRAKNWAGIVCSRNASMVCGLYYGDDNQLHYTWNNDSQQTWSFEGPTIPQDQWAFVACTIEPDKAALYVYTQDEGLKTAINKIKHIPQTLNKLKFGWDTAQDSRRFCGLIDEVRIYDYALSKSDILRLCKK